MQEILFKLVYLSGTCSGTSQELCSMLKNTDISLTNGYNSKNKK
jgi:hypothetical protein